MPSGVSGSGNLDINCRKCDISLGKETIGAIWCVRVRKFEF